MFAYACMHGCMDVWTCVVYECANCKYTAKCLLNYIEIMGRDDSQKIANCLLNPSPYPTALPPPSLSIESDE